MNRGYQNGFVLAEIEPKSELAETGQKVDLAGPPTPASTMLGKNLKKIRYPCGVSARVPRETKGLPLVVHFFSAPSKKPS